MHSKFNLNNTDMQEQECLNTRDARLEILAGNYHPFLCSNVVQGGGNLDPSISRIIIVSII